MSYKKIKEIESKQMSGEDFIRLANNFYNANKIDVDFNRIITDSQLSNYVSTNQQELNKKYKVALTCICLNPHYWPYAKQMVEGAKTYFLPGHNVDFYLWSDIPEANDDDYFNNLEKISLEAHYTNNPSLVNNQSWVSDINNQVKAGVETVRNTVKDIRSIDRLNIFPTEPVEWPFPTLMRYNLFLQREEKLKEYDYIFYCDVDMRFVGVVGDEILGDGLTAAQHPMYALRKEYIPPYEPNNESSSYIKRPGKVIVDNGKPRFMPFYYAGGFQGGKTDKWISAMKDMRMLIDKDLTRNYIPIWNDESAWNKYLTDIQPSVVLSPSYIYPDSLIKEYYEPIWGRSYQPKLITLTKPFNLSKEGGQAVQEFIKTSKPQ